MIFVRCRGGVSHSPLEYVEPRDVAAATTVLAQYLAQRVLEPGDRLGNPPGPPQDSDRWSDSSTIPQPVTSDAHGLPRGADHSEL
jgi:hypothetical protein